jgi:hypothetical protein
MFDGCVACHSFFSKVADGQECLAVHLANNFEYSNHPNTLIVD